MGVFVVNLDVSGFVRPCPDHVRLVLNEVWASLARAEAMTVEATDWSSGD